MHSLWSAVASIQGVAILLVECIFDNGSFSFRWNLVKLVLMNKGKSDLEAISAYCPLNMMNTSRKLFEKLIKLRLPDVVSATEGSSTKQYGFKAERAAIKAIEEVVQVVKLSQDHNRHCR